MLSTKNLMWQIRNKEIKKLTKKFVKNLEVKVFKKSELIEKYTIKILFE